MKCLDLVSLLLGSALATQVGCASGDKTLAAADPEAAPQNPSYAEVTAILDRSCVPCHRGGEIESSARGAISLREDDPNYDTCEGIQANLADLARTAIDEGSMPPGAWPRLDERERLILRRWIAQGACSPCTSCP